MGDIIHLTVYSLLSSNYKLKMDSIYTAKSLEDVKFGKSIISDKVIKFYMKSDRIRNEMLKMKSNHLKSFYNLLTNVNGCIIFDYIGRYYGKGYVRTNSNFEYIETSKCLDIVDNFLKTCCPVLEKIFIKAYKDGRILFTDKTKHVNYKIGNIKKNYIVLGELCDFHDMCTLVHELGHMYADCFCEFDCNDSNSVLKSECFSMYIEYYFNQYCLYNRIYYNDAVKENKMFYNMVVKNVYDSMKNNCTEREKEYVLKYALGGIVSHDTYMKYGTCPMDSIFNYFSKNDIISIIRDLRSKEFRRK